MNQSVSAAGPNPRPGRLILLDEPYVSETLQKAIAELGVPVFATGTAPLNQAVQALTVSQEKAKRLIGTSGTLAYMNSENSLDFLRGALVDGERAEAVAGLKDKHRFRELIRSVFPEMQFRETALDGLESIDPAELRFPLVVKPSVGFFSAGVKIVHDAAEWTDAVAGLIEEMANVGDHYPTSVLEPARILIEDYIPGDEYAIDAYFTEAGEPVVLNILRHVFRDDRDILDILYLTNRETVRLLLSDVETLLGRIGERLALRSFPLHIEVRKTPNGQLVPIEVNPYRFAGWCTTDLAFHAHDINVYASYFNGLRPDWETPIADAGTYGFVIMHPPEGEPFDPGCEVDEDALVKLLGDVRELRLVDHRRWGILGIAFVRFESEAEAELVVHADFRLALRASSENGV